MTLDLIQSASEKLELLGSVEIGPSKIDITNITLVLNMLEIF